MNSHESSPLLETADGEHEIEVHFSKAKKKVSSHRSRLRDREALSDSRTVSDVMNRAAAPSGDFRPTIRDTNALYNINESQKKVSDNDNNNSINRKVDSSRTCSEIIVNLSIDDSLEEVSEIACLFVASFDARRGNLIEWRMPTAFNLDGVEFKAIPSGAHSVTRDYMLFKHARFFGVAAFASCSLPDANSSSGAVRTGSTTEDGGSERGVRSRSVGVLCATYANLTNHLRFLESAAQALLDAPRAFGELVAYFERCRAQPHMPSPFNFDEVERGRGQVDPWTHVPMSLSSNSDSLLVISGASNAGGAGLGRGCFLQELRVHDWDASFYEFVKLFGVRVFALWRLALLRRRILFYAPPPVGVMCYHVYWCAALANHAPLTVNSMPPEQWRAANPLFLVALVDAARIADEQRRLAAACANGTPTQTPTHVPGRFRTHTQSATSTPSPSHVNTRRMHSASTSAKTPSATAMPMFAGTEWIACTSERLYETKTSLYDALVCAPNGATYGSPGRKRVEVIRVTDARFRFAAAVGRADRSRMRKLAQLAALAETREARDAALRAYFTHLNTELLNTLQRLASRPNAEDRVLTAANVRMLQLDPSDPTDRHFLHELVETLELELTVALDSPSVFDTSFCPCCCQTAVE